MQAKESFSNRLKELRGAIAIKDLAKQTAISPTALYKAEGGQESVSWKTIETAYGDLCKFPDQYEQLLMLWAMTQSERPVSLYRAREALTNVMREEAQLISKENASVIREMELMNQPDQRLFTQFARHFRISEHTRKITQVWMECSDGWLEQMERKR